MKKRLISLCLASIFIGMVYALANKYEYTDSTETEEHLQTALKTAMSEGGEDEEPIDSPISYNVPLEEIAEKIEYIYAYETMVSHNSESEEQLVYGELGKLPTGKDIIVSIYAAKGNKILFLPEDKANTEILLDNMSCNMYYSEQNKGYCFYALIDWLSSEYGVPANGFEDGFDNKIVAVTVGEKGETDAVKNNYSYLQADLDDLVKLGEASVNFESWETIKLSEITMEPNHTYAIDSCF